MNQAVLEVTRHKIDAETYYRMAELGLFKPEDRVELIEGDIIDMAPIGPPHEANVNWLNKALVMACGDRAIVSPQNSLRVSTQSAPQPDFAIWRQRADFYATGDRASPADTLLVVEVADTSLAYDRSVKLAVYAAAGIPEYWIVDIRNRALLVHRQPQQDSYAAITEHRAGDSISLVADPAITITLGDLF